MNDEHLVSVIIPVFNGDRFLNEAIESVINQTYKNYEIIVVDDGSTDKSAEIAKSYNEVIYKYQDNGGVASARNTALKILNGDFVAFLDSDDYYPKDKLAIQMNHLLKNKTVDCCIGQLESFVEPGYNISPHDFDHFTKKEKIGLATLVANKFVFDKVGYFNINYIAGSDFEWITRAIELKVKIDVLPYIFLNRRIHDNNISIINKKYKHELRFSILKESLDRKRKKLN